MSIENIINVYLVWTTVQELTGDSATNDVVLVHRPPLEVLPVQFVYSKTP